jgi:hypothetical protein
MGRLQSEKAVSRVIAFMGAAEQSPLISRVKAVAATPKLG